MRSGWSRGAIAGVGVVAALTLGACSSAPPVEPEVEQPIVEPRGLQPPRSKIADGLVVPEGAELAGSLFSQPGEEVSVDDWAAYLTVDGNPFAVWDDLAQQARAGDGHPMLAGSADACTWTLPDDAATPEGGEATDPAPRSTEEATGSTAPASTTAPPAADPNLEAITITSSAPTQEVDGVECSASAPTLVKGIPEQLTMHLRSGSRLPATLTLQAVWGAESAQAGPTALRTTLERQSRQGGPVVEPGPDPVPDGAEAHVPEPQEQEKSAQLGPFGPEVNCFADVGYQRLRLPHGADFVAGGFADGTISVLRVISVEAALTELREQVSGDGTSEDGDGTVETVKLVGGGPVTRFSFSVSGGGGGCGALSSPDGRFLIVSAHGD
ncbi:MAG: hypothetical protein JWO77_1986 [Ilumatobacteraceae bacterium]|nr:hypothetical protein [Ilumatobacteraceae bacterium]